MKTPVPSMDIESFERFLKGYFSELETITRITKNQGHLTLLNSIQYTLFSGGKRFRPSLGYLLSHSLEVSLENATPWLAAIECVHTYSLIHDDLPAMDNDSVRRGKPSNHIVFSETTALLAGDALLTEAFNIISKCYANTPKVGLTLIQILSRSSGFEGMVGGQALDLSFNLKDLNTESLQWIHNLKTGKLIQAVAEGIATIAELEPVKSQHLCDFGTLLGFAFQLKDDLLDYDPKGKDYKNLVYHLGFNETQEKLTQVSQLAQEKLNYFSNTPQQLLDLIHFNITRTV